MGENASKFLVISCWVHYYNKENRNRMNLVSKWPIFQMYFLRNDRIWWKWIKIGHHFMLGSFFEWRKTEPNEPSVKMTNFSNLFFKKWPNLVKMDQNWSSFYVGFIFQIKKNWIEWTLCQNDKFFVTKSSSIVRNEESDLRVVQDDKFTRHEFLKAFQQEKWLMEEKSIRLSLQWFYEWWIW